MKRFPNVRTIGISIIAIFAIALLATFAGTPVHAADNPAPTVAPDNLALLFTAIASVESSNGKNVHGDNGNATGTYQIHYDYWSDSGTPGHYSDCRNADYSRRVMLNYWKRYCPDALQTADYETLARVHNGGPRGAHKASTIGYWHKVESAL